MRCDAVFGAWVGSDGGPCGGACSGGGWGGGRSCDGCSGDGGKRRGETGGLGSYSGVCAVDGWVVCVVDMLEVVGATVMNLDDGKTSHSVKPRQII